MLSHGAQGLHDISRHAVLNANYIRHHLSRDFHLEYQQPTLHEVVFDDKNQAEAGVHTMDMAKRLLDLGFHPPTVYFPLIVPNAIMIEPTESESKAELDAFIDTMRQIAREAREAPKLLQDAPQDIRNTRFDETLAARKPVLTWKGTGPA